MIRRPPIFAVTMLLAMPAGAAAQTGSRLRPAPPAPTWEVEIYTSFTRPGVPIQGEGAVPAPGAAFATVNGRASRRVPSWFFGDGALLFNEVSTQAGTPPIASASAVVAGPTGNPGKTWGMGTRVSRVVNPRVSIEGTFEYSRYRLRVRPGVLDALETTRASYVTAWNALFASAPGVFQNPSVTATTVVAENTARRIHATGALVFNILTGRPVNTPYVSAGVGLLSAGGEATTVTMTGRYRALLNGTAPADETDVVTLRYQVDRTVVAASIGLGWKRMLSARHGVRVEMRETLASNPLRHLVSTAPAVVAVSSPGQQGAAATSQFVAIQFANLPGSATRSSLDTALDRVRTFKGTGMESRFSLTAGLFWRF